MTNRILVAVVFLGGCAVGGVSSQLMVPKASAQQAATLTKWEYVCIAENLVEDMTTAANKLGAQSWELAGSGDTRACFKRPKM